MNRSSSVIRALAAGALVVAAAFIPVRVEAHEVYTSPRNAEVSASGAGSVRIEAAAGLLRVEGRSGIDQVRVRGTAKSSRRDRLDDIRLIAERRGDVVYIKADIPEEHGLWNSDWQRALDLVIEVPSTLAIDASDGSGEAEFTNTGAVDITDGSGGLRIMSAHGDVRINDGSGEITVDGVEGSVRVSDGSGSINVRNVTRDFTVDADGSGEIDGEGIGGTMRVESDGSGSISGDRIAGDFVVEHDGGGSIRYDTVKGSVRIPDRKRRS